MCLWGLVTRKKYEKKFFFASLKSLKKESDPELDPDPLVRGADPDLHLNVTDSQHCFLDGFLDEK
jgi:hypothetical protein